MLAKVRQVHPEPAPARSPERERLAAAIERRTAAADELSRVRSAVAAAWERVFAGERAIDAAEEALAGFRADEPRRLAAQALGEDPGPALTTPTPAEAAAAVDLDRKILHALEAREREAQKALDAAVRGVQLAARAVVKAALEPFAAEFAAARALIATVASIALSLGPGAYPGDIGREAPAGTGRDEGRAWTAALEALEHDPDAALPGDRPEPPAAA